MKLILFALIFYICRLKKIIYKTTLYMTETMKKYTLQILKIFAILKYVLVKFKKLSSIKGEIKTSVF